MRTAKLLVLLVLPCFANLSHGAAAETADDPIQNEEKIVADAHAAVGNGSEAAAEALLNTPAKFSTPLAPSIILGRRAVMLCGWLQNENNYSAAERLAAKAVAKLAHLEEGNDTDCEERLYWEAWLEGRVLDHKAKALLLLREAEKLSPTDERITDLELYLVKALNAFGR